MSVGCLLYLPVCNFYIKFEKYWGVRFENSPTATKAQNIMLCKTIMFSAMFVRCKHTMPTNGGRQIL